MPRKHILALTEPELRLMEILWKHGTATVAEVSGHEAVRNLSYSSIQKTLRGLEKKSYVDHVKHGGVNIYAPQVSRDQACDDEVRRVLDRFFSGSAELLVHKLARDGDLTHRQLAALGLRLARKTADGDAPAISASEGPMRRSEGLDATTVFSWRGKRAVSEN